MLAEQQSLLAELDELHGLRRGVLRLGLPRVGAGALFAAAFAVYRARYPGITLELVEHGSEGLLDQVRSGAIELAATLVVPTAELATRTVHNEPLVALLPGNHELATRGEVSFADLAQTPFLLLDPDFALNRLVLEAAQHSGIVPSVQATSTQADFLVDLVAAGMGVTFLPELIAKERPRSEVAYVRLRERIDWHIQLVWRRDVPLSPAAQAWVQIVEGRDHWSASLADSGPS
jgi:DNA-binding transcriptional LysR family regulator